MKKESEFVLLEKYLIKKVKKIGWKAVFIAIIQFQRKHYKNDGYRFTDKLLKKLGYTED